MRNVLKWVGRLLGALGVLLLVGVAGLYLVSEMKLRQTYPAPPVELALPDQPAALERGQHLVTAVSVCVDCHGENFAGGFIVDDPALGRLVAPNLTRGRNGLGNELSDADMLRAIRYGVKPNGASVKVMPSDDY